MSLHPFLRDSVFLRIFTRFNWLLRDTAHHCVPQCPTIRLCVTPCFAVHFCLYLYAAVCGRAKLRAFVCERTPLFAAQLRHAPLHSSARFCVPSRFFSCTLLLPVFRFFNCLSKLKHSMYTKWHMTYVSENTEGIIKIF